jgi:hypothetical protein
VTSGICLVRAGVYLSDVAPLATHNEFGRVVTLTEVEEAIKASWSIETCDPIDTDNWSPDNPSRGQCGATALVVRDLLGGELLEAEVLFANGERQGFHYWNRLAGIEVDLTRDQFRPDEVVQPPQTVVGPPEFPWVVAEQHAILRQRVFAVLHLSDSAE